MPHVSAASAAVPQKRYKVGSQALLFRGKRKSERGATQRGKRHAANANANAEREVTVAITSCAQGNNG